MTAAPQAPAAERGPAARVALMIDEAIYAVERLMIAVFLIAATVTVAIDFAFEQLDVDRAPWAPYAALAATFLVLWAACTYSEKVRERPFFGKPVLGSAYVAALGTMALGAAAITMLRVDSWMFYLGGGAAALVALFAWIHKTRGLKRNDWIAAVLVVPAFVYFALHHVPQEYSWSKEFSMLLILWIGFFGASVCAKTGAHLRLEALVKAAPERAQKWLAMLGHISSAVFCAFMALIGWNYVFHPETGIYRLGGELPQTLIPEWFQTVAIPIAFGLAGARFLGAAVSSARGGKYGAPVNLEAGEAAEGLHVEKIEPTGIRKYVFPALVVVALVLPFLGNGGILGAVILGLALIGAPIFVLLGCVVITCFVLWGGWVDLGDVTLVERVRGLADNQALLTIPFFVMSGTIMSRGAISNRLLDFSNAFVGWLPGGLGIAAVVACAIFAAISGSSPATVVAVGSMVAPALITAGYKPPFAHGIVTSAGSLGILIPPSIPMVIYAIVNTTTPIEVQRLFAAGYGPGLVIALVLASMSIFHGIKHKLPRQPFSVVTLGSSVREGYWALAFPILMALGVKYLTTVELACFSVVYAVFVEVVPHRALKLSDIPKVLSETATLLGAFLVILVMAMAFGEYVETQRLAAALTDWVVSLDLEPWQFLLVVNVLLLVVGALLDIMSAIFICVPLLAPLALAAGVDPIHFAIIFIVNLEIGYLTPPIGLNLFVASTVFKKPVEYMIKSVLPFIGIMLVGLAIITFDGGASSVGVSNWILDIEEVQPIAPMPSTDEPGEDGAETGEPVRPTGGDRVQSIEEMMREMEALDEEPALEEPLEEPEAPEPESP